MSMIIDEFKKNFKNYIDSLMKSDYKDLILHIIVLMFVILLSLFVAIPVETIISLIKDIIINIVGFYPNGIRIIVSIIRAICDVAAVSFAFMYLFNKRYEDTIDEKRETNFYSGNKKQTKKQNSDFELPKMK